MLLAGYLGFLALVLARVRIPSHTFPRTRNVIAGLAALGCVIVGLRLGQDGGLATLGLIAGGAAFLFGLPDLERPQAERVRLVGFAVCTVVLAIPSSASVFLPLAALMLFGLPFRGMTSDGLRS